MPDEWEKSHGLDPSDASDGRIVSLSADDYTNLEMYLNELAGDPVEFNGTPAISAFETIQAEDYTSQSGTRNEDGQDGSTHVAYIENGDYIAFGAVDFTGTAKSFTARITGNPSQIELYLDNIGDTPYAVLDLKGTGSWNDWEEVSCNLPDITGKHSLYLVFRGGSGYLMNIDSFVFGKTAVPVNGRLIRGFSAAETPNQNVYKLLDGAAVGSPIFADRDFTFTSLPDELKGAEQILTSCNDKGVTGDVISFTASEDIDIYIALDSRMPETPAWMSDLEKTGLTAVSSNGVTFDLYRKTVPEGEKAVLGGNGYSLNVVNYSVLVTEKQSVKADVPGDLSGDGIIDVFDLILSKQLAAGITKLDGKLLANADVNEDGKADISDTVLINSYILGKIKKFK